ncbi:copper chaperone PCu(A)C [Noviherbaspirillum sp. CPCC 100848]|uniref:Copper chaperone PCu(A)C n=1 Tax=Noviherbaspirillum album TaxID=3080276 RepID=A0ABU6JFD0_9BURK|nr:copper chaperone PCu(A)C [Noviherbaspirillum sp. CPCC 100848]MEC4722248.1 copper chaperone PCu(A)C [Noviherbaspirillum sp. CPCC 100848]
MTPILKFHFFETMKTLLLAPLLASVTSSAFADVSVTDAWARATVPGQPVGAVYMKVSSSNAVRLVDIQTEVAKDVQVHTMHHHDGVMKMREHGELAIQAGQTVELAPGGLHLMLLGLKKPLSAGENLTVKLTFEDAKKVRNTSVVSVPVRPLGK